MLARATFSLWQRSISSYRWIASKCLIGGRRSLAQGQLVPALRVIDLDQAHARGVGFVLRVLGDLYDKDARIDCMSHLPLFSITRTNNNN